MRCNMKRVRLTALAEFDLVEAQDFYAPNGAWVLDHFMENVSAALDSLADFAGIHPVHFGHHRMMVPHFPFSVYYDIEGDDIIVKAIRSRRGSFRLWTPSRIRRSARRCP